MNELQWLYDGVSSFENPDFETPDSNFYNNPYGVSVYTDWMSQYGAVRSGLSPDIENAGGEIMPRPAFPTLDSGMQVGQTIIDNQWAQADGDYLTFAKNYVYGNDKPFDDILPEEQQKLKNYAGHLETYRNHGNQKAELESVIGDISNMTEMEFYKESLYEMFPEQEQAINSNLETGTLGVDDLITQLQSSAPKAPAKVSDDVFTLNNLGIMKDAFDSGVGGMASDIGGMFEWWGMEDIGGAVKDWGDSVQQNNQIEQPSYEFDYNHLSSKEFWMVDAPRALPSMLSLMIPYFGFGRAGMGAFRALPYAKKFKDIERAWEGTQTGANALKTLRKGDAISASIAGAVGGRQAESLIEAGGTWNHMKEQGYTDEQAGVAGWEVYKQNQKLLLSDVTQLYGIYGRLPFKLANNFGKFVRASGIGAGVIAEGYEEVLQGYFQELGQAVADDEIDDPELILDIRKLEPEMKKAFAIGVIGGGAFEGVGRLVTKNLDPKQQDELIDEIYVRYESRAEAKKNATEDVSEEFSSFLTQASGLPALKNKIKFLFSSKILRDVFTASELERMGYNPKDYKDSKLPEDDPRYDKEQGGDQFYIQPDAINYLDEGDGKITVLFGQSATNEAVLEDTVEALYRRLPDINPVLYKKIQAWIQSNQEKSRNFQGRELFSKSFVYNFLGIQSEVAENNTGSLPLPPELSAEVNELFVNPETGENILNEIEGIDRREDRVEQDEILQIPEESSYLEENEEPMSARSKPAVQIIELGSNKETVEVEDFVQWTSQGVDQFTTPKKVVNIMPDNNGRMWAMIEGETSGVPLDELTTTEPPATGDNVFIVIDNNQGELFTLPKVDPTSTEQKPIVKRTVKMKGLDKLMGDQLTLDDVVKEVNELDKDNSKTSKIIKENPKKIKNLKENGLSYAQLLKELSQRPQNAESLAPFVHMNIAKEVTKGLNIPVKGSKKSDHLLAIQEFFESQQDVEGSYIGAMIPVSTMETIDIQSTRMNLVGIITDAYKRLQANGTFVVNLPEGTTPKAREKLFKLLTGEDRAEFKMPKRGMVKIPKQQISKSASGLFAQDNYNKKESTPTKLVFNGKGKVPPSLVNFMSIDPTKEGLGGRGGGLQRVFNEKKGKFGVSNKTFTTEQYQDYIDRAVSEGVAEITEELDSVYEALGILKDNNKESMKKFIDISLNWYSGAVDKSIEVMGNSELPSLKNNTENQMLWRVLLGLTSPNQAVDNNFNYATEIYKHIEEKGKPEFVKDTQKNFKKFTKVDGESLSVPNSVALNIEMFYDMQAELGGVMPVVKFLTTKMPPSDIIALRTSIGLKSDKFKLETVNGFIERDINEGVYGTEIFGYKVGAFVGNILGLTDITTIDIWMTRQINRWLGEPFVATNKDVGRMFGDNFFAPNSAVTQMYDAPKARQNFHLFRDVIAGIANDKRITKHFGRKIQPMEAQALLWYMEKALYLNQNARSQKELKESDYGSYAEIRQESRRNASLGNKDITKPKDGQDQGAYIRGSGKRAFESTFREDSTGASLGRIDLNQDEPIDGIRPFNAFGQKQSKASKEKEKEHNKLYAPKSWKDYLVTFSTQIGKLHPKLPAVFRRFQFFSLKYYNESMEQVKPLVVGLKDLHKQASKKNASEELKNDYLSIDLGLKNRKYKEIKPLLEKYGLYDAVKQTRALLDKIAVDKEAVGFDSGFLEDYFPRVVKDHLMLKDYLLEYVADQSDKDAINEEIEARSAEIGRKLELEEQVEVMQRVLLGRGQQGVGKPDNLKQRKINTLNDNANQFYAPTYDALSIYIAQVTEAIAGKRFLGQSKFTVRKQGSKFIVAHKHSGKDARGMKFDTKRQAFDEMKAMVAVHLDAQGIPLTGMDYTIDSFILKAMEEYGLDVKQEDRLRKLLQAYFNKDKGNPFAMALKTTGYITSMGSLFSAITQIADVGLAVWRSGDRGLARIPTGAYRTIKALAESLVYSFGQRRFNEDFVGREEYGVDAVAEELKPDGGMLLNLLQKVFKVVQLERLDQVGKDTTVNATLAKFRALAKNPTKREYSEFIYRLQQSFTSEEISQILTDLTEGNRSELVLLLSYTELLKVQPIGKSEVPIGYLENPNGRVFYQLKTFFLKRFDVYRDELKFINSEYLKAQEAGNKSKMRQESAKYYARIVGLVALFVLAEMGTDEMKDQLAGRETDLSDKAVQNLLKLVGLSKFTFWTAKREGLDSALLKMIMPPITGVVNDIAIKDIYTLGEKYNDGGMPKVRKHLNETGLRVYNHIPVVGKHLYWWNEDLLGERPTNIGLGRGNMVAEKYNKKKAKKKTRRGRKDRK